MRKIINNKKGFTLIELIVVIAIIAILGTVAVPKLTGFQDKAKGNADIASAKIIQSTIRVFEADGGTLPTGITNLTTFNTAFVAVLPDGVPEIQKTGNHFYYLATTGEFVCKTNSPLTTDYITLK